MNKIKQSILAIVIGLVSSAGVSYAAGIWEDPDCGPTGCNTETPINVGSSDQSKIGRLAIVGGLKVGNSTFTDVSGNNFVAAGSSIFNGAASFNGLSQFNQLATFNQKIKIPTDASKGKVLTSDEDGDASWADSNSSGIPGNINVFNSDNTWTVPSGVSKVMIDAWGGGGGGAGGQGGRGAAGGGGGGYTKKIVSVESGKTFKIIIGDGGSAGAHGSISGGNGGHTRVKYDGNLIVKSNGGVGGYGNYNGGYGGEVEDYGSNDLKITGGAGNSGGNSEDYEFGGSGGGAASGGGGGRSGPGNDSASHKGGVPGGGGGGGHRDGSGGAGGKGRVVIYW